MDLDDEGNEVFSERKVDALRGATTQTGARENVLVYLRRDVGYLVNRTMGDKNRPSLSDTVSFAKLMERRDPWYFRAADYVVDATGGAVESEVRTKREIKEEVLEYFYAETGAPPPTGRQLAPLGKTTERAVAPRAVTGATRYLGPSMYWSSTPRQALSSGNSYASGRMVGAPCAETFAASSRM